MVYRKFVLRQHVENFKTKKTLVDILWSWTYIPQSAVCDISNSYHQLKILNPLLLAVCLLISDLLVFVPSSKKISQRTLTHYVSLLFC
jgi:hypothetical protein